MTYTSDMHARITFKGGHDETLVNVRKVVAVACEAFADFGYPARYMGRRNQRDDAALNKASKKPTPHGVSCAQRPVPLATN